MTNLPEAKAAERTSDVAWRNVFESLEKDLIECPHCKTKTFSELKRCFNCEKSLPKKISGVTFLILSAGEKKKQISLAVGAKIRGNKISKNLPSSDLVQIIYSERTKKMGARNLSNFTWTIKKADGTSLACEPNKIITLEADTRISIIPKVAQLNVIALT